MIRAVLSRYRSGKKIFSSELSLFQNIALDQSGGNMNRSISCCTSLQGPMVQNYGRRSCQGFQSLLNGNKIDARAVSHLPAGVKAVVNQTSLVPRASQLSKRLYSATRIAASGGDGGGSSGNGGGGDGGDDKSGSGGNWFGAIWSFYLMQLEKNPVC